MTTDEQDRVFTDAERLVYVAPPCGLCGSRVIPRWVKATSLADVGDRWILGIPDCTTPRNHIVG